MILVRIEWKVAEPLNLEVCSWNLTREKHNAIAW
jgi:hypothetical protein